MFLYANLTFSGTQAKLRRQLENQTMEPVLPSDAAEGLEAADTSDLGKMIFEARKKKGWTLEETGKAAGIGRSTLSKIENNQTKPSFDVVRRLTKVLELQSPQLFVQSSQSGISGRRDYTLDGQGEPQDTPTYGHELLCTELTSKTHAALYQHDQGARHLRIRYLDPAPGRRVHVCHQRRADALYRALPAAGPEGRRLRLLRRRHGPLLAFQPARKTPRFFGCRWRVEVSRLHPIPAAVTANG